jgi:E3 SUMO-protein ligase PIAS1
VILKGFAFLTSSRYVKDILEKTPKSQETVTIEPNGEWHLKSIDDSSQGHTNGNSSYANAFDDDDDDLVISEVNSIGHRRLETPKISTPTISTPVTAGRDVSSSAGPRGIASTSAKRPMAAVIDLTLSDDDDDLPPPPKRQNTSMNGYSGNLPSNSPISPGDLGYL